MTTREKSPGGLLPLLLLALILCLVAYVRVRLLQVPLERDEGEFAYMGQLLIKGLPPYANAYTMKLPGASAAYAVIMLLFGQTTFGIHLGLLLVTVASSALIFLLARRLFDRETALLSCAVYLLLSVSQSVYGISAHATHFVVLFVLAGSLLLLRYLDGAKLPLLALSGISFGTAFLMKQHAALLVLFAVVYLARRSFGKAAGEGDGEGEGDRHLRSQSPSPVVACAMFIASAAVPYLLILLLMVKTGGFDKFWFWTVQYAREYVSEQSLMLGVINFTNSFGSIFLYQWPFWLLAGAGAIFLYDGRLDCRDRWFLAGFLLFSLLAVTPGLQFREHYFVLALPAVAILAAAAARSLGAIPAASRYRQLLPCLLIVAAAGYGIFMEKDYLFRLSPVEVSRATYHENPFPEALPIARYLREHTSPGDRIAVFGSEPEIYFYADRLSASGHIYMYGLMENQPLAERMQREMVREIQAARPKYVVMTNVQASWLVRETSPRLLLDWSARYVKEEYEPVGVVEIVDSGTTNYLWDGQAAGYTPASNAFLTVFKRRG